MAITFVDGGGFTSTIPNGQSLNVNIVLVLEQRTKQRNKKQIVNADHEDDNKTQ